MGKMKELAIEQMIEEEATQFDLELEVKSSLFEELKQEIVNLQQIIEEQKEIIKKKPKKIYIKNRKKKRTFKSN